MARTKSVVPLLLHDDDDSLCKLRDALSETVGADPFAREEHVDTTVAKVALCFGLRAAARVCPPQTMSTTEATRAAAKSKEII